MKSIVTGGAGFIGAHLVKLLLEKGHQVLNLDALTYSGNLNSLKSIAYHHNYQFLQLDICDAVKLESAIIDFQPDAIFHLAAESHVDNSIAAAGAFMQTNIIGTFNLLETARKLKNRNFRFIHVSTDEVYGALGETGAFTEETPYQPNSPYSASKAASDHLARAWNKTYGLPVLITHCSNNYGGFQFPEKLIPKVLINAVSNKEISVYGTGKNVRDWLHVQDHVEALFAVWERGKIGETYNIGGGKEWRNIDLIREICQQLDQIKPKYEGSYQDQIRFVADRAGHDFRYAIDNSKIEKELLWKPRFDFETGIKETILWYLSNEEWWREK